MSYMRVVPRDLFNEAKLLKCLGLLSVRILEGHPDVTGLTDDFEDHGQGFEIENTINGDTYCSNYKVLCAYTGQYLHLNSRLNSKLNYPLILGTNGEYVFDDDGNFTPEFIKSIGGKNADNGQ